MMQLVRFSCFLIIIVITACKERYEIDVPAAQISMLVVEGILNTGQDTTSIRLTKTLKLRDSIDIKPELNAVISVEGKDNTSQFLVESFNGYYTNKLSLTEGGEYRLRIFTSERKEYVSDFVLVKKSPVIDSLNWKRDRDGVSIFVNTHDPENNTRYYKWEYEETYELQSKYYSTIIYENEVVRPRRPEEYVFSCWKHFKSSSIILGSSAQLAQDVIFEAPIIRIPNFSEKLAVRYSLLVKQYCLTKTAYEYFGLMKKNTESLGTIFDAQPSELRGNIFCVSNPDEIVIGYITASTVDVKRMFIKRSELPAWGFSLICDEKEVANHPDSMKVYFITYMPYAEKGLGAAVTAYYSATPTCVDCTLRGGSLNRPSFW